MQLLASIRRWPRLFLMTWPSLSISEFTCQRGRLLLVPRRSVITVAVVAVAFPNCPVCGLPNCPVCGRRRLCCRSLTLSPLDAVVFVAARFCCCCCHRLCWRLLLASSPLLSLAGVVAIVALAACVVAFVAAHCRCWLRRRSFTVDVVVVVVPFGKLSVILAILSSLLLLPLFTYHCI